jgi:hypothetical protein
MASRRTTWSPHSPPSHLNPRLGCTRSLNVAGANGPHRRTDDRPKRTGEKPSLAATVRVSLTVDPEESKDISESAILHNEEAFARYIASTLTALEDLLANHHQAVGLTLVATTLSASAPIMIVGARVTAICVPVRPTWSTGC